jgi:hypothetical protein
MNMSNSTVALGPLAFGRWIQLRCAGHADDRPVALIGALGTALLPVTGVARARP